MSESLPTDLTFEQALEELERVIRDLEDGETGLEAALASYERGVGLLKRCYGQLRDVEQRIQLLTGVDADGQPLIRPFAHTATAEPASAPVETIKPRGRKPDAPEMF
jgi:exodeoxyribonuclease VII small subunit